MKRQLEDLKQRLLFLDDPQDRRNLLRQALDHEARQLLQVANELQAKADHLGRRLRRYAFLLESVTLLMPTIGNPSETPISELIEIVKPTHPELAAQLREFLTDREA